MCPVLYHIVFTGNEGLFYLSDLNYTAFLEREVLVQDGLEYRITEMREVHLSRGKTLTLVNLVYPPVLATEVIA